MYPEGMGLDKESRDDVFLEAWFKIKIPRFHESELGL